MVKVSASASHTIASMSLRRSNRNPPMSPVNEIGTDTRRCGAGARYSSAGSIGSMGHRSVAGFIGVARPRLTAAQTGRGPANGAPSVALMRRSRSGRVLRVSLLLALARAGEVAADEHVPVGDDAVEGEYAEHAVRAGSP